MALYGGVAASLQCIIFLLIWRSTTAEAHECVRPCREGDAPRLCYYHFQMEWYQTLSRACYDCPRNASHCFRPHCVAANGRSRPVVTVNRQLPGPSIQVCEGDTIVVDVENRLGSDVTAIHWHGNHQRGTPFMDGVPMVTQCPILPYTTFRYEFPARNPGTHYWHSHVDMQRMDGAHGTLVVRQSPARDPHAPLYDYDLPEHVLLLTDWMNMLGIQKFTAHHHALGDNKPESMLINGKGRDMVDGDLLNSNETTPVEVLYVQHRRRYRIRVVSNGLLNCPLALSVDGHDLMVIATDGTAVDPLIVQSLVVYSGERFDFILEASQNVSNYWIRLQGLLDCDARFTSSRQVAILRYDGAPEQDPEGELSYHSMSKEGRQLNALNTGTLDSKLSVVALDAVAPDDRTSELEMDYKFYLAFDFNAIDNPAYHDPQLYPILSFPHKERLYTPQFNGISMETPSSPPLTQYHDLDPAIFCNATSFVRNCSAEYCECLHTLKVPLNSTVELVLIDNGYTFDANHPIHLHGYSFRVVAMARLGSQVSTAEVKQLDANGLIKRKLEHPVVKDTVTVPDGGYTVVRFVADNPGIWLMHCHITFHMELGMALLIQVGEVHEFPPAPKNFPRCGNWAADISSFQSSHSLSSLQPTKSIVPLLAFLSLICWLSAVSGP